MTFLISTNELTVNRLVALCSPLLLMITELPNQITLPNLKELHKICCKEIKTIENKATQIGYSSPIILATRFYLSALIDELIVNTAWGKKSEWNAISLIKTFQRENNANERFFEILKHEKQNPNENIDVIELAYICLKLGFQGKYRQSKDKTILKAIINDTYQLIQQIRGEFSKKIVLSDYYKKKKPKKFLKFPPIWVTAIITLAILGGIFFIYYQQLERQVMPIQEMISKMSKSNAQ